MRHGGEVANYSGQHLLLVGVALVISIAIALPLGIAAARNTRIATPLFGVLGALYTIPSLAILALLVQFVGLGFWPAIIMLVIYAQFILVRNFATGIREVPAAQVDAARGIGMTAMQQLLRVEIPQAMPIMLGGVRLATVTLIAIATLASYVNAGGLGVLIFGGMEQNMFIDKIIAGSVPTMILAIAADQLFRFAERLTGGGTGSTSRP